jgi:hypothetical protein
MTCTYHLVNIDGHETVCIGGAVVADETNPGFLWLTSVQGEKLLHVHHSDYRAITRGEAEDYLRALHAKKQAEGSGPLEAICVKTGEVLATSPSPVQECSREKGHDGPCNGLPCATALMKTAPKPFKQLPAWPDPPRNIYNN